MTDYQVTAGVAAIRREPAHDAMMDSQLLAGEAFRVEKEAHGFGYGVSAHDGYRGWVAMETLSAAVLIPTHKVTALRTYVFSRADLKSAARFPVSMNAKIAAGRREGRFIEAQRLGWVFAPHLGAPGESVDDYVEAAERFLHAPYLWGGKESLGLDCSGLVQTALEAAGVICPRDSGDQEAWAKANWRAAGMKDDLSGLQRGDLVFWPGHVGIMTDPHTLLHANAHHMMTAAEPLERAVRRIAHKHAPVSGVYRAP